MIHVWHPMIWVAFSLALSCSQAAEKESPIACNLRALTVAERQQHAVASKRLLAALTSRHDVEGGYVFHLDKSRITLLQVAEWVAKEQRCCPFFDFKLELVRENGPLSLTLTGRSAVKQLIETELR